MVSLWWSGGGGGGVGDENGHLMVLLTPSPRPFRHHISIQHYHHSSIPSHTMLCVMVDWAPSAGMMGDGIMWD